MRQNKNRIGAVGRKGLSALESPPFRRFAVGMVLFLTGLWLQRMTVGWMMWETSQSAAWLGILGLADLLPTILFGPLTGSIADRFDRLKIIRASLVAGAAQAGLLALLVALGPVHQVTLVAVTFIRGLVSAFYLPAAFALLPRLISSDQLSSAIAINSVLSNASVFVGSSAGGVILAYGSSAHALTVTAACHLGFIFAIRVPPTGPAVIRRPSVDMWRTIIGGIKYAVTYPPISMMLTAFLVVSLACRGLPDLLPAFVGSVYERKVEALSALAAAIGIGAVSGATWISGKIVDDHAAMKHMSTALLTSAVSLAFFIVLPFLAAGLVALFVFGFAIAINGIVTQATIQRAVADDMRGRVMGLYAMIFRAAPGVGSAAVAFIASVIGLRPALASGAIVCLGLWIISNPAFRKRTDHSLPSMDTKR